MDHRKVLDKAPVPILVHRAGTVLYLNEAAAQLGKEMGLEVTPEGLQRLDLFSLNQPEEQDIARRNYDRIMESGSPQFNITRTIMTASGDRMVILGSARPIDWEGEPALEVCAVFLGPAAEIPERFDPLEATLNDGDLTRMVRPPARRRAAALHRLTPREIDVAMLTAEGYSTDNIAARLGITVETTRTHLKKIYRKTDTHSRVELTRFVLGRS